MLADHVIGTVCLRIYVVLDTELDIVFDSEIYTVIDAVIDTAIDTLFFNLN